MYEPAPKLLDHAYVKNNRAATYLLVYVNSRIVNEFNLLIYYKSIVIQICDKHKEELVCHSKW